MNDLILRDALPQVSTIRLAIEQTMKVTNWRANGPDIGYGDLRVALDYACCQSTH